ncbi:hypothetical protein H2203_002267 [Taxawa tesnikishii (nom. ined.)]|nr:hypothetical protein H2203_002267 [Dothideales sp. JES 119]
MSESAINGNAPASETAGSLGSNLTNGHRVKSPTPAQAASVPPRSSPPPAAGESALPSDSVAAAVGTDADQEVDAQNDSEAETIRISPVKQRELAKRAGANGDNSIGSIGSRLAETDKVGGEDKVEEEERDRDIRKTEAANGVGRGRQGKVDPNEDDESDVLSDVSSARSSSSGRRSRASSGSPTPSTKSEENGHFNEDRRGSATSNPRKRKHRESSLHPKNSMEPPRRRVREDDDGEVRVNHARSSSEGSASPKLRRQRHRRTNSSQSAAWAEGNGGGEGGSVGRKRRAATQFPLRETKVSRTTSTGDSDTSSESSHQIHQNRLTRNINRAVSTPGRTMGRDHKRHVNKYGFTRLAEACESGDLDMVKEWRGKDPEQLEQREFAGNTPLQVASLNGYPEIVEYLLEQGCNVHVANTDKDTPLIDAQNLKGQQALDVITDETENATEIRFLLREAIEEWKSNGYNDHNQHEEGPAFRPGPTKGLQFMARTSENLMKLVSNNDREGVQEFLDARVQVNNDVVAAAARTGDLFLVNMLLADMSSSKARRGAEKPMLAVIGTSHYEMVKSLTLLDTFDPTWRNRQGLTWHELAEQRQGPNWRQEKQLLQRLYDEHTGRERQSSSPVTKRENGTKRRRSPVRRVESDVEMEDAGSPEPGRSRRRLMSKKDMRAVSKEAQPERSPEKSMLKPEAPRKVGRPRTVSITSPPKEPLPKRRRSSSVREKASPNVNPALDETTQERATAAAVAAREVEEDRKKQEAEDQAAAAAAAEAEARAKQQAEKDAAVEAQRQADAAREAKEEEESRREEEVRQREAERQAETARLEREKRDAEEARLKEEEEKINALPSALRHVLGLPNGASQPEHYKRRLRQSDLHNEELGEGDELWMLSYQAAGILGGSSAAQLLNLPADPLAKRSPFAGVKGSPLTDQQRLAMLPCIQSASLVHGLSDLQEADEYRDPAADFAIAERARRMIAEDRGKFIALPSLRWIRLADFHAAVEQTPHLQGLLPLEVRTDCLLDEERLERARVNGEVGKVEKLSVTRVTVVVE